MASSGVGDGLGGPDGDEDGGADVGVEAVAGADVGVRTGVASPLVSLGPPHAVANERDAATKTTTGRMPSDGT
jgi:hypothetical protein